ncbi:MAG: hypothetical protein ACYTGQ_16450 [Planctomycetota bacterium]|jgi:Fe-S-cluster containining protein
MALPWEQWKGAAQTAEVDGALRDLYARLDAEITELGPTCWVSGNCCRFVSCGHRLYVTGLEIAWMIGRLEEGAWGEIEAEAIPDLDGCPFQVEGKCSTHGIRPLGCRVYYCDPNAQGWQQEVYEKYQDKIRALHSKLRLEYRYREGRVGLSEARLALA